MTIRAFITLLAIAVSLSGCNAAVKQQPVSTDVQMELSDYPPSQDVMNTMETVANWQIPRLEKLDYLSYKREESETPKFWIQGAFYAGLTTLAERSNNRFYDSLIGYKGDEWNWQLGDRPYHADDHLIGQTYIWYYKRHKDADILAPSIETFDKILANKPTNSLEFKGDKNESKMHSCQQRWCWADAIFMAPPTWFGLTDVTKDKRYADYANQELKATLDYLYDKELHLVYRDSRFFDKKGKHGEPVFWARGTGWVIAGLARTLQYIPEDHPDRDYYVGIFREMAAKLKTLQKADGSWAMSLMAGEKMQQPETSGTAFITYGMAWGIRQGILDEAQYKPTVLKAWSRLNAAIQPSGKLGWVQGVGAAPGEVGPNDSQLYVVGAFLLAGSMLYDLAKMEELPGTKATYARFVPEREDDFAFENDKIAFRVYGPASPAKGPISGVDAWYKKVPYPIIDKWYVEHWNNKSYHVDHGEGYDIYHTGTSRGVGGTAVWVDGKAYPAGAYKSYKIISNDGKDLVVRLDYAWSTPLGNVTEAKIISLSLGDQFYQVNSSYTLNGEAAKLPIAIGLATHDEKAKVDRNAKTGRISTWEVMDGKGVGTGAIINAKKVKEILHTPSEVKDESHIWIITETDAAGQLEFRSGFVWQGAADWTWESWNNYLDKKARR